MLSFDFVLFVPCPIETSHKRADAAAYGIVEMIFKWESYRIVCACVCLY